MLLQPIQKLTRKLWSKASVSEKHGSTELSPALSKVVNLASYFPVIYRFRPGVVRKIFWCMERPFNLNREQLACIREYQVKVSSQVNSTESERIKLRVYYPDNLRTSARRKALVYYHGGGLVLGSIETHDLFCRSVAKQNQQVVISVDYRLAPEYKFPVPVEDAICAWNWVCEHAGELNIDISRTGVGGDSAGGYLATSVVLQHLKPSLSKQPKLMPAYQWLIYPMLDLNCNSESYRRSDQGMLLTRDFMLYFREHLLSHINQVDDPVVSPALTESLAGSPPTYLLTVHHDPLMDEGVKYAQALQQHGTEVIHQHYPDLMHGFISYGGVCPVAREAVEQAIHNLSGLTPTAQ